jgi:hypothetical protein
MCFEQAVQVELVDIKSNYAVVVHAGLREESIPFIFNKFNSLYKRAGSNLSLELVDLKHGLFQVFGDYPKSFQELI